MPAKKEYDVAAIVADYESGLSLEKVSKKYKAGFATIGKILKSNGVTIRGNQYTEDRINVQQLITDYQSNERIENIIERYELDAPTLYKVLKRQGVPLKGTVAPMIKRKKTFNYDFFKTESIESAYWAGFIMADGCLNDQHENRNWRTMVLAIGLSMQDIDHLALFAETIGIGKQYIETTFNRAMLRMSHPNFKADFERWGIVPRKTYNFVTPSIPDQLLPHYLRGWFDGDGHVKLSKNKERLSLTGNASAISWYKNALTYCGYKGSICIEHKEGKVWSTLCVNGKLQVYQMAQVIRSDNDLRLHRKWEKFYEIYSGHVQPYPSNYSS
jgi:Mor family transcriptional regulator